MPDLPRTPLTSPNGARPQVASTCTLPAASKPAVASAKTLASYYSVCTRRWSEAAVRVQTYDIFPLTTAFPTPIQFPTNRGGASNT